MAIAAQSGFGSQPERMMLAVGTIELILPGSIQDADADARSRRYLGLLADRLSRLDLSFTFLLDGQTVRMARLELEYAGVAEGSIKARYTLIGTFLFGTYSAIAAYPSFKDGVVEIREDLARAVDYVIANAPERHERPGRAPITYALHFRDSEELEQLLRSNRR